MARPVASLTYVRVLDEISVVVEGKEKVLTGQLRQLMAGLVAYGPGPVPIELLADAIWLEGRLTPSWEAALRNLISQARRLFPGSDSIVNETRRYQLALPSSAVDLWSVLANADLPNDGPLATAFQAQTSFPATDPDEPFMAAASRFRSHRRQLIQASLRSSMPIPPPILDCMAVSSRRNPYDIEEVHCVLDALCNSGRRTEAEALHRDIRDEYERTTFSHRLPELDSFDSTTDLWSLPSTLAQHTDIAVAPRLGSIAERGVHRILNRTSRIVVFVGDEDHGGEELLGLCAARCHHAGRLVVHLVGPRHYTGPLQPFLSAFPFLDDVVSVGDDSEVGAQMLSALLAHMKTVWPDEEAVIVVSNLDHFDSASIQLLGALIDLSPTSLQFLVSVAHAPTSSNNNIDTVISSSSTTHVAQLDPLTPEEMHHLVAHTLPNEPTTKVADIASRLTAISQGRFSLVQLFLANLESFSNEKHSPTFAGVDQSVRTVILSLPTSARRVGTALSVCSSSIGASDLATVVDVPVSDIEQGLFHLAARGFIAEVDSDQTYAYTSRAIADAFQAITTAAEVQRLHAAFAQRDNSIHTIADHQRQSGVLVDVTKAVQSLVESAREYLELGASAEALAQIRMAERLHPDPLDFSDRVVLASALSRTGYHDEAAKQRAALVDEAVSARRLEDALEAALAGLPESERYGGEADRLSLLEQIPNDLLPDMLGVRHLEILGRLALLEWRNVNAFARTTNQIRTSLRRAKTIASSTNERLDVLAAEWLTGTADAGASVLHDLTELATHYPGPLPAKIQQLLSLAHYSAGDRSTAIEFNEGCYQQAAADHQPVRMWHASLFRAMVAYTDGDWGAADTTNASAAVFATNYGIAEGFRAQMVQQLYKQWMNDSLHTLAPLLRHSGEETLRSIPGQAARVGVLHQAGDDSGLLAVATNIVNALLHFPSPTIAPAAALLVPFAVDTDETELCSLLVKLFDQFTGRSLVLMAGLADFGPAERYVALLEPSEAAWHQAIEKADRGGGVFWPVRTRLDAFVSLEQPALLDQARERSCGTDLAALVSTFTDQ